MHQSGMISCKKLQALLCAQFVLLLLFPLERDDTGQFPCQKGYDKHVLLF